jgi:hypothetical protein
MKTIAKILLRASSSSELDTETLKIIAIFCLLGVLVSLLFASQGFDITMGGSF